MPIYEYECGKCGHKFEKKQGFHDKPGAVCPECKGKAKRVFHPAPVIFKGSGFYVTDHPKSSNPASSVKKESKGEPSASKSKE